MGRPSNWMDLVREHGWGTAPTRIANRARGSVGGCVLWTGTWNGRIPPQIRMSVAGIVWTESVQRVAWMLANGAFVPEGWQVRRSCGERACLKHLFIAERCSHHVEAVRRRMTDAARRGNNDKRKLTRAQAHVVREWARKGRALTPLIRMYSVSAATIYAIANGMSYLPPGAEKAERGRSGRYRRNPRPGDLA